VWTTYETACRRVLGSTPLQIIRSEPHLHWTDPTCHESLRATGDWQRIALQYGISATLTRTGSDFKCKVTLRLTVSRPVYLGVVHHLGPKTRVCYCQLLLSWCGAPPPPWRERESLTFTIAVVLASAAILGSEAWLHTPPTWRVSFPHSSILCSLQVARVMPFRCFGQIEWRWLAAAVHMYLAYRRHETYP
jgi:hypothetical protein